MECVELGNGSIGEQVKLVLCCQETAAVSSHHNVSSLQDAAFHHCCLTNYATCCERDNDTL